MQNLEKLVFTKINKSVNTRKFEFSAVADLEKEVSSDAGANYYSDAKSALDKARTQIAKSASQISVSINAIESMQKEIRKKADELDVSYDNIPIMKKADSAKKSYKERIKILENIEKNIQSFGY
jgi:prefoldin subunit 5